MQRLTQDTFTIHSSGLQAQQLFNISHFVLLHQTVSLYIDGVEYQPISLYNQSDQIFISTRQMTKFDLRPIYSLRIHLLSLNSITQTTIGKQKKLNNTPFLPKANCILL